MVLATYEYIQMSNILWYITFIIYKKVRFRLHSTYNVKLIVIKKKKTRITGYFIQ